jgi:hypothetical protein
LQGVAVARRHAVNVQPILADRALVTLGSDDAEQRKRLLSSLPVSRSEYDDFAEVPFAFGRKHRISPFHARRRSTRLELIEISRETKTGHDQIEEIDALFAEGHLL